MVQCPQLQILSLMHKVFMEVEMSKTQKILYWKHIVKTRAVGNYSWFKMIKFEEIYFKAVKKLFQCFFAYT